MWVAPTGSPVARSTIIGIAATAAAGAAALFLMMRENVPASQTAHMVQLPLREWAGPTPVAPLTPAARTGPASLSHRVAPEPAALAGDALAQAQFDAEARVGQSVEPMSGGQDEVSKPP